MCIRDRPTATTTTGTAIVQTVLCNTKYSDCYWDFHKSTAHVTSFLVLTRWKEANTDCVTDVSDTNECAKNNGDCSQICNNTAGSYHCLCEQGFFLTPDNKTCQCFVRSFRRSVLTFDISLRSIANVLDRLDDKRSVNAVAKHVLAAGWAIAIISFSRWPPSAILNFTGRQFLFFSPNLEPYCFPL